MVPSLKLSDQFLAMNKFHILISLLLVSAGMAPYQYAKAQHANATSALLEQASEVSGLVIQYRQDIRAITYVLGSFSVASPSNILSPAQLERLHKLNQDYSDRLAKLSFDQFSIQGQVDYILLKGLIERSEESLVLETALQTRVNKYLPFNTAIYDFERLRQRGAAIDAEKLANDLHSALLAMQGAKNSLKESQPFDQATGEYLQAYVEDLRNRLKNAYDYYYGYDPLFNWWVPAPYKDLTAEMNDYIAVVRNKTEVKIFDDGSGIGGSPIGRSELAKQLLDEMIPYSPEELLKLAEQEFAWCEAELLKASREMGFGDDWRAAQEQVKNSHVAPGEQSELIIKLYNDANEFVRKRDLLTIPPLSEETWGMLMMSPEQQLVSPFFLGGRNILIAYPTHEMSHARKLMSMRGNNPYFSRGTVQHELIPGHHLQHFMTSRYKPYRAEAFRTPFWTEGWTLYWELLLYDMGFPQTPEERIGMLFWRMHRCARITFSIKYHLGEWTPQQCIDYLVDRVGHEPSTAHGEVKRSFEGNYGPLYQLAYLVGGLQVWSLKKELVDSGKMGYKEFHDRFMKENYMPIEMLRATLSDQKLNRNFKSSWRFYNFK